MRYGLIGEKLGHSFSKQIHELLGNREYELCEIPPEDLRSFLAERDFEGINVTIPYKREVLPYCCADKVAKAIGSVNTLVNREGQLYAYNTDYPGFVYMCKKAGIDFVDKSVVLLGSGGTSETACYAAIQGGAKQIYVLSRSGKTYETAEHNVTFLDYSEQSLCMDAEILVNTTPVGMYPNNGKQAVSLRDFPKLEAVADVIFNPLQTALLQEAKERGIRYTNGLPMLVAQAWYAERIFFDEDVMLTGDGENEIAMILRTIEREVRNIVLVGMPGVGKTTVGKAVAQLMNRTFADTDEIFAARYGMTAGAYIQEFGEAEFRIKESEIVQETAKRTGIIIATGGGSIIDDANRKALRQNGTVIFLTKDIGALEQEGRPLSQGEGAMQRLYKERISLYREVADAEIAVCDDVNETIIKVRQVLDF